MRVEEALGTFVELVDSCAPGWLEGLYVVGSYALDDWHEGSSDLDIVAVTAEPATDDDFATLRTAHALLVERQPLPHVDGPFLAWGDLVAPPMSLHRPWTLDGELHHDGDCFELNPVTWYVLAERGVTVRGPSPDRLGTYLDLDARVRFVVDNLRSYWAGLADDIRRATADAGDGDAPTDLRVEPSMLEWCALGALRLHYTAFTGDVTSKTGAGQYGLTVAPAEHHGLLGRALAIRRGEQLDTVVGADELGRAGELIRWCIDDVLRAVKTG